MRIAVSSTGNDLSALLDERFGRCAYFIMVDPEDMSFEVFENESMALAGGAGIQAAQFVASQGAQAVITGNLGPNAVRTLSAAGVEAFVGQRGTVREVVERYKRGDLTSTGTANVGDHYGMGGGGGRICGGGMGMGRGRGMGRGMRHSTGGGSSQGGPTPRYRKRRN
jgi:predicted Fe-Mo cluster-binding NifX family protein